MSDVADTTTALALIESKALVPTEVFKPGGVSDIIASIRGQVAEFKGDISTPAGRKEIASLAYKIARSKTALDAMGKELTDQFRKQAELIHADRRVITKELDELAQQVRKPLTDWENAEKSRIEGHESALRQLRDFGENIFHLTSEEARARHSEVEKFAEGRDWQEFAQRAQEQGSLVYEAIHRAYRAALQREEEERLAAGQAAREAEEQRQREEQERQEREARIAAEAAEAARLEAEGKAADELRRQQEEAEAARVAAEVAAHNAAMEVARQAEAERRRIEEERDRVEAAYVAAQEQNLKAIEAAEAARVAALEAAREAEAEKRKVEEAAAAQREADRRAALQAAHEAQAELYAAIERERIAGEERARKHREQEADNERKREANVAHNRKINREALEDIREQVEIDEDTAKDVLKAIANSRVRHVRIQY